MPKKSTKALPRKSNSGRDFDFVSQWKSVFASNPASPVDVLATITEDTINYFLSKHHDADPDAYKRTFDKSYNLDGATVTFAAAINIPNAAEASLAPLDPNATAHAGQPDGVWNPIAYHPEDAFLTNPQPGPVDSHVSIPPNIRIHFPRVEVHLSWPRVDGHGNPISNQQWDFPLAFEVFAEGFVSLRQGTDSSRTVTANLVINPTRVKFMPVPVPVDPDIAKVLAALSDPALQETVKQEDRKFRDLVTIALNIVGYDFVPNLVQTMSLPVIALVGIPLRASLLDISNKSVTFGATADVQSSALLISSKISSAIQTYYALQERDVAAAGGITSISASLAEKPGRTPRSKIEALKSLMPLSSGFIEDLQRRDIEQRRARGGPDIEHAVGVAIDQYLLSRFINGPLPINRGGREDHPIIPLVLKGFVEWWLRVGTASVSIDGTTVSGAAPIDVGGGIGASVYDLIACPPGWRDLVEISARFVGTPKISLEFSDEESPGISFKAHPDLGGCDIDVSGLGWPFDKVASAIATFVIRDFGDVLAIVCNFLQIQIMPPSIDLQSMMVSLQFSGISFHPLVRAMPGPDPDHHGIFIGADSGLTVSKTGSRLQRRYAAREQMRSLYKRPGTVARTARKK